MSGMFNRAELIKSDEFWIEIIENHLWAYKKGKTTKKAIIKDVLENKNELLKQKIMGEQEFNACSICGEKTIVERKYYYYDIKCDCCSSANNKHFEIVWYCRKCKPVPPRKIRVVIKPIST